MDIERDWLRDNQEDMLNKFNKVLFQEAWDKYAQGTISSWEMESLCFYYHEHELADVNKQKYGLVDFNTLSTEPEIDYMFKRNGKDI